MKRRLIILLTLAGVVILSSMQLTAQEKINPKDIKISEYRPKSVFVLKEENIQKAKYPVIDMHSHAYETTKEGIEKWVKTMDANNIEKVVILTYAYGEEFDKLYDLYKGISDRFEMWCGLDTRSWGTSEFPAATIKELERCYNKGAKGVGELHDKGLGERVSQTVKVPGLHFDSDELVPVFAKCAELHMPINVHLADPIWMYEPLDNKNDGYRNAINWAIDLTTPGILNLQELITSIETCCDKNPNTIFIACHFINISHDYEWLGRVMDSHPNLYLDNSARHAETAPTPRATKQFYEKYANRIFFGTDNNPSDRMYKLQWRILESADEHFYAGSYHWPLQGIDLPDKVLKKIYRENSIKFWKKYGKK